MSEKIDTGGPASEKTLLDAAALKALPKCVDVFWGGATEDMAKAAYDIATAMVAEKRKREGEK